MVFDDSHSMGLVGAGYSEYDCDYAFATVQTLNRDSHLYKYEKDAFDCIILDEAHHSSAGTYQKVMNYFTPKLFLGMTATPDKTDDETREFVEGKPDYADEFINDVIFKWESQIGSGPESKYMNDVNSALRKHLFVKKSDAEKNFYYMGTFDIVEQHGDIKMDNSGRNRPITKVTMKMHNAVREDLLRYLQSSISVEVK